MKAKSVAVFLAGFAAGILFITVLLQQAGTLGVIKAAASNPFDAPHAVPNALPDASSSTLHAPHDEALPPEQLPSDAPGSFPRGPLIPVSGVSPSSLAITSMRFITVIAMKP